MHLLLWPWAPENRKNILYLDCTEYIQTHTYTHTQTVLEDMTLTYIHFLQTKPKLKLNLTSLPLKM